MRLNSDNKPHVAVVGSADLEFSLPVPHIPAPGDSLFADRMDMQPGGKASNICSALAVLGARVFLFSCVGMDSYGAQILYGLKKRRVNVDFVERIDQPTGLVHNIRDPAGNRIRIMTPGAAQKMSATSLFQGKAMLSSCQLMIVLSDVSEEAFLFAINAAHHFRLPVLAVPSPAERFKREWIGKLDLVVAGPAEARTITGARLINLESADSALNWFLKSGCGAAVLYLGRHGAAGSSALRDSFYCPAPLPSGITTPESEDVFIAALAYCLCSGLSLKESCTFAATAAWRMNSAAADAPFPSLSQIGSALTV